MDPLSLVLVGAVGGVALAAWYFAPAARIKRALRRTPRTAIAQVREGAVAKVVGTLRYVGSPPLVAPLSSRACAYFEVTVEQRRTSNRRTEWRTVLHLKKGQDFLLDDATGTALVPAADQPLLVAAAEDHTESAGFFSGESPELQALLAAHRVGLGDALSPDALRAREGVLEAGEQIAVGAAWRRRPALEPSTAGDAQGYRDGARWLVAAPPPGANSAILVSDDPKAAR